MRNPDPWRPDPKDDRIPIGPGDVISMHRGGAINVQSPAAHQPFKHVKDVLVCGCIEPLVGQLGGQVKKMIVVHAGIVRWVRSCWHSYFPMGFVAKNFASTGTGNYRKQS